MGITRFLGAAAWLLIALAAGASETDSELDREILAQAAHPLEPHEVVGGQEAKDDELTGLERDVGYLDYVKVRFTASDRFVAPSDYGTFSTTTNMPGIRGRVTLPLSKNAGLRVSASYNPIIMDFNGVSDLFGTGPTSGDPFSTLQSWTVRLQCAYIFENRFSLFAEEESWSLLGEMSVRARYEEGMALKHGTGVGGALAVGYELPNKLQIAAGLSLKSSITDFGLGVGPYAEFDWRVNPRWRIRSKGTGAQIEYAALQDLVLFTRAQLHNSSFRLDDRPGVGRGSLRLSQIPAGLGFRWNFTRLFRLEGVIGAIARQQLRVKDDDGNTLSSVSSGPVPYFELRIDYRPGAR